MKSRNRLLKFICGIVMGGVMLVVFNPTAQAQSVGTCVSGTGNNATVLIPAGTPILHTNPSVDFTPEPGDEFYVFRPDDNGDPSDDLCVGWVIWNGTGVALTVWGDNSVTTEVDGMLPNEVMQWRAWDQSTGLRYAANVEYSPNVPFWPNGEYAADRFYQLQVLAPTAVTMATFQASVGSFGGVNIVLILLVLLLAGTTLAIRDLRLKRTKQK